MTDPVFVVRVMTAMEFDLCDQLWWRCDGKRLSLFITCSDSFAYACADCEPVTPDNVAALERAITDCVDAGGRTCDSDGPMLFVARQRGRRPLPHVLKDMDAAVLPLFEALP